MVLNLGYCVRTNSIIPTSLLSPEGCRDLSIVSIEIEMAGKITTIKTTAAKVKQLY